MDSSRPSPRHRCLRVPDRKTGRHATQQSGDQHAPGKLAVSACVWQSRHRKKLRPRHLRKRIDRELRPTRPLFFTVHLTLDHWPYAWAAHPSRCTTRPRAGHRTTSRRPTAWTGKSATSSKCCARSICWRMPSSSRSPITAKRSTRPMEALATDDNPIMQALSLDRPAWGHGTSVLALDQYRIMLGMRRYGGSSPVPATVSSPVSFNDIAPTIQEMLGVKSSARFDGHSLLPLIEGREGAEQNFVGTHPFHRNRVPDAGGIRHAGRRDRFRKDAGGNAGLQHRSRHRSSHREGSTAETSPGGT